MEDCMCFSCSQYRNLDKIEFLKKSKSTAIESRIGTKRTRSGIPIPSNVAIDRLPDEVLLRIFNYIPPINMDNFLTLLALEMVSKRIRRCALDNDKIWKDVTKLVFGFHPDLPKDQYLCHIGHLTLQIFLQRVKKIAKIVVNLKSDQVHADWICQEMIQSKISPLLVRYAEKIDLRELSIHNNLQCQSYTPEQLLVTKLNEVGDKGFLERLYINKENFSPGISSILAECTSLKIVKLSDVHHSVNQPLRLAHALRKFKFLEVLEISGYSQSCLSNVSSYINLASNVPSFALHTIRFTNPYFPVDRTSRTSLSLIPSMISHDNLSLRHFEIHWCPIVCDYSDVPKFLNGISHPTHLNLVLCPCLDLKHLHIIVELLKNAQWQNVDDMKITLTFNHWDGYRIPRMGVVCNLFKYFAVPYDYEPEDGDVWTFKLRRWNGGMLSVTVKLEIVEDNKVMCQLTT